MSTLPAVAASAVQAIFGDAGPESIVPIHTGGSGAGNWRLTGQGCDVLLRVESSRDMLRDPHRTYACVQIAAEAGVAPRVHYSDPDAGVLIVDFIPSTPLQTHPGGWEAVLDDLAGTLAKLHAAPAFPTLTNNIALLREMMPAMSARLTGEGLAAHMALFERIAGAWRPAERLVPSHHDLNPGNILFDGQTVRFIDWEGAYQDDPMIDLATLANYFSREPAHAERLLSRYLGRAPTDAERAKLLIARQLVRLTYGTLILSLSLPEMDGPLALETAGPPLEAVFQGILQGQLVLTDAKVRKVFAEAWLSRALELAETPEFKAAVAV